MKCCNCNSYACYTIGPQGIPLCSNCHRTYQSKLDNQICTAMQVSEVAQLEDSMSKFLMNTQQNNRHPTSMVTNLNFNDNNIGMVNTGDGAQIKDNNIDISSPQISHSDEVILALHKLSKGITECNTISTHDKDHALELVDFLSDEASKPKSKRKSLLAGNTISQLANIITITTGLKEIAPLCLPILNRFFS